MLAGNYEAAAAQSEVNGALTIEVGLPALSKDTACTQNWNFEKLHRIEAFLVFSRKAQERVGGLTQS